LSQFNIISVARTIAVTSTAFSAFEVVAISDIAAIAAIAAITAITAIAAIAAAGANRNAKVGTNVDAAVADTVAVIGESISVYRPQLDLAIIAAGRYPVTTVGTVATGGCSSCCGSLAIAAATATATITATSISRTSGKRATRERQWAHSHARSERPSGC
jgi:hypothetical protein